MVGIGLDKAIHQGVARGDVSFHVVEADSICQKTAFRHIFSINIAGVSLFVKSQICCGSFTSASLILCLCRDRGEAQEEGIAATGMGVDEFLFQTGCQGGIVHHAIGFGNLYGLAVAGVDGVQLCI